jgi:hypothetical protein
VRVPARIKLDSIEEKSHWQASKRGGLGKSGIIPLDCF